LLCLKHLMRQVTD